MKDVWYSEIPNGVRVAVKYIEDGLIKFRITDVEVGKTYKIVEPAKLRNRQAFLLGRECLVLSIENLGKQKYSRASVRYTGSNKAGSMSVYNLSSDASIIRSGIGQKFIESVWDEVFFLKD